MFEKIYAKMLKSMDGGANFLPKTRQNILNHLAHDFNFESSVLHLFEANLLQPLVFINH